MAELKIQIQHIDRNHPSAYNFIILVASNTIYYKGKKLDDGATMSIVNIKEKLIYFHIISPLTIDLVNYV